MRTLILYGRDGCHLCDEARELAADLVAGATDVELVEVDIESDRALFLRYLERIPVLELDGEVVSELVPDPRALRHSLLNSSGL